METREAAVTVSWACDRVSARAMGQVLPLPNFVSTVTREIYRSAGDGVDTSSSRCTRLLLRLDLTEPVCPSSWEVTVCSVGDPNTAVRARAGRPAPALSSSAHARAHTTAEREDLRLLISTRDPSPPLRLKGIPRSSARILSRVTPSDPPLPPQV